MSPRRYEGTQIGGETESSAISVHQSERRLMDPAHLGAVKIRAAGMHHSINHGDS